MDVEDGRARRLRLRDLHMLRVVAECGSMAQAAERLALSQPAISKAVTEMERLLGLPLLDRSPRGVEATAYGQVLLARGRAMLDELRQGIEEMRFLADPTQGEVRIGATEPMTAIVAEVIDRLSRRYPRMRFHVEVDGTGGLLQGVRARSLDMAITRTAATAAEADLQAEPLFHDPLVVMAGARHRLARRRRRLELAELLDEAWTLSPPEMFLGRFVVEAFHARGLEPPASVVTAVSVMMRVSLLRTSRFLSILPRAMLRFPAQYPGLVELPVDLSDTRRPIALVALLGRRPSPAAGLFMEEARATARAVIAAQD